MLVWLLILDVFIIQWWLSRRPLFQVSSLGSLPGNMEAVLSNLQEIESWRPPRSKHLYNLLDLPNRDTTLPRIWKFLNSGTSGVITEIHGLSFMSQKAWFLLIIILCYLHASSTFYTWISPVCNKLSTRPYGLPHLSIHFRLRSVSPGFSDIDHHLYHCGIRKYKFIFSIKSTHTHTEREENEIYLETRRHLNLTSHSH